MMSFMAFDFVIGSYQCMVLHCLIFYVANDDNFEKFIEQQCSKLYTKYLSNEIKECFDAF